MLIFCIAETSLKNIPMHIKLSHKEMGTQIRKIRKYTEMFAFLHNNDQKLTISCYTSESTNFQHCRLAMNIFCHHKQAQQCRKFT